VRVERSPLVLLLMIEEGKKIVENFSDGIPPLF